MWFILINWVWKLYLKRKRQFSLFCDSLPVWEKSYFWDRKLPGGVFWRHLPKESTWYLLRRDRGEVTTSGQTVSFYSIRWYEVLSSQISHSYVRIWSVAWKEIPGVFFYDTFLTSSCGRNFEDIDMRFFANCRRRMVVFSICNMWSFTHYSFLNWKFEKGPILPKNALLCEYWPCFLLTTRL